jgi:hypothetical protein
MQPAAPVLRAVPALPGPVASTFWTCRPVPRPPVWRRPGPISRKGPPACLRAHHPPNTAGQAQAASRQQTRRHADTHEQAEWVRGAYPMRGPPPATLAALLLAICITAAEANYGTSRILRYEPRSAAEHAAMTKACQSTCIASSDEFRCGGESLSDCHAWNVVEHLKQAASTAGDTSLQDLVDVGSKSFYLRHSDKSGVPTSAAGKASQLADAKTIMDTLSKLSCTWDSPSADVDVKAANPYSARGKLTCTTDDDLLLYIAVSSGIAAIWLLWILLAVVVGRRSCSHVIKGHCKTLRNCKRTVKVVTSCKLWPPSASSVSRFQLSAQCSCI